MTADIIINIGKNDMETYLSRLLGEAAASMFWRYARVRDAHDARLEARVKHLESQLADATKPVEAPTVATVPVVGSKWRLKDGDDQRTFTVVSVIDRYVSFTPHLKKPGAWSFSVFLAKFEATPTAPECPFQDEDKS